MAAEVRLRRFHRVVAVLFLVSIVPAGFASSRGGQPAFAVYLPLFPLLGLTVTGSYLLVRPWVQRLRSRVRSRGRVEASTKA